MTRGLTSASSPSHNEIARSFHRRRISNGGYRMRVKFVMFGFTAVAILTLVLQASPQAIAQNANKPAPAKKSKPAAAKNKNAAQPAAAPAEKKPVAKKHVRRKKKTMAMSGVPSGVGNCLKH